MQRESNRQYPPEALAAAAGNDEGGSNPDISRNARHVIDDGRSEAGKGTSGSPVAAHQAG